MTKQPELSEDLLRGARAIAVFLFGTAKARRKIYYLASTSKLRTFKLGSMLCARKSVVMKYIEDQEDRRGPRAA